TILIVISATIGATILFLAARSAIGNSLREKAGPLYKKIETNMRHNAIGYLLFMRLVPLFPFFMVNIVPALFNIRLISYIVTTFVGIIPGTFVYANVGRELGTIESLTDLASTETLIAFSLLGIFALIPTIYKQFQSRNYLTS
ncbi:MAG: TVP38/TMEM64 family protein, partial [Gammaproteobacteria bacterium]